MSFPTKLRAAFRSLREVTYPCLKDERVRMKTEQVMAVAVLIVGSSLALQIARAQQPGIKRTDLQQHDLSVPGREVVQARVQIDPGSAVPEARHPGEEIIYVFEGTLEYQVEGKPPVTLKAGDCSYSVPARPIHTAKNVGSGPGAASSPPMWSREIGEPPLL